MGAMRRAGVWLGLIEDDDERGYGYDDHGYEEEYQDEEEVAADPASLVRARVAGRLAEQRAERNADREAARASRFERSHVMDTEDIPARSISRPVAVATGSFPVHDNLALVPEPVVA